MSNSEPLEKFEQEFIERIRKMAGRSVGIRYGEGLEALAENTEDTTPHIEGQMTIYINPRMIDNYARTQREAERLNREEHGGAKCWVGCSCGRLHARDPETGHVDTGWY